MQVKLLSVIYDRNKKVAESCIVLHCLCVKLGRRWQGCSSNSNPSTSSRPGRGCWQQKLHCVPWYEGDGAALACHRQSIRLQCSLPLLQQPRSSVQCCGISTRMSSTNAVARKMKNSRAQALESDSKATAALGTHSHKEGDSLLSMLVYTL